MATKLTYEQYKAAYKTARQQYRYHADMVSGVWGLDGKEFCDKYHLDYDQARDYEMSQLDNDFDDFYIEEHIKIRRKIGKLTDKQEQYLIDYLEKSFDWEDEQVYFWYDLATNQLAQDYPDYNDRYYEEHDFKD